MPSCIVVTKIELSDDMALRGGPSKPVRCARRAWWDTEPLRVEAGQCCLSLGVTGRRQWLPLITRFGEIVGVVRGQPIPEVGTTRHRG